MFFQTFYPNLKIFLHGYIRHIRDISQLCAGRVAGGGGEEGADQRGGLPRPPGFPPQQDWLDGEGLPLGLQGHGRQDRQAIAKP